MTDTKTPTSTPFSVYCQARAVTAMGREYPTNMCGNDPRLLFAAAMGIEEGLLSKRKIEALGQLHALPTEAELTETIAAVFCETPGPAVPTRTGSVFGADEQTDRSPDPDARLIVLALGLGDRELVSLAYEDCDDHPDTEPARIVDVIIGGRFRPTRATWQKLIDAGLPMCSWQEAFESWDLDGAPPLSKTKRDIDEGAK